MKCTFTFGEPLSVLLTENRLHFCIWQHFGAGSLRFLPRIERQAAGPHKPWLWPQGESLTPHHSKKTKMMTNIYNSELKNHLVHFSLCEGNNSLRAGNSITSCSVPVKADAALAGETEVLSRGISNGTSASAAVVLWSGGLGFSRDFSVFSTR